MRSKVPVPPLKTGLGGAGIAGFKVTDMIATHAPRSDELAPPIERRGAQRLDAGMPRWLGTRAGTPEEVAALRETLTFDARQMAELRKRCEQLMGVNSDLRCRLGEMTLRWVDCRYGR